MRKKYVLGVSAILLAVIGVLNLLPKAEADPPSKPYDKPAPAAAQAVKPPTPARMPFHGVLIDDFVRPVAAEEPIKKPLQSGFVIEEDEFDAAVLLEAPKAAACQEKCQHCVDKVAEQLRKAGTYCAAPGQAAACAECPECPACPKCSQCPKCPRDCAEHTACDDVRPDEAAQVILEIMERLGGSRLEGTYFQRPDALDPELVRGAQMSPRQALIQYIRALEASHKHAPKHVECEAEFIIAPPPDAPPVSLENLEVLRGVCENLENVANLLERGNLYERADQVRDLALQLRHDARRASGVRPPMMFHRVPGTSYGVPQEARRHVRIVPPTIVPPAEEARTGRLMFGVGVNPDAGIVGQVIEASKSCHDLEREIEQLRQELHKAKAKLHEISEPRDE